jgi:hypothetical protein
MCVKGDPIVQNACFPITVLRTMTRSGWCLAMVAFSSLLIDRTAGWGCFFVENEKKSKMGLRWRDIRPTYVRRHTKKMTVGRTKSKIGFPFFHRPAPPPSLVVWTSIWTRRRQRHHASTIIIAVAILQVKTAIVPGRSFQWWCARPSFFESCGHGHCIVVVDTFFIMAI